MTKINDSGYKLYVQYASKKELKENSEVRMKGIVVGKVIGFDKNPDAYIVILLINEGTVIPLLSEFTIKTESNNNYINIEPSNDERLIHANEYLSGNE